MGIKEWLIEKVIVNKIKESTVWKLLEGKKSYLVMTVIIVFGAIDAWNAHCGATQGCKVVEIPAIVFTVLGALGIWTRAVAKPK